MSSHRRLTPLLFSLVVAAIASVTFAAADTGYADSAGTQIASGWYIQGATITGPGLAIPRHLNDSQAAAFVQAWLPAQLYDKLKQQDPPRSLPTFTVHVDDTINGAPEHLIAYYVSDGQNAWISMPIQDLGGGAIVNKRAWFLAPQRTVAAFEGKLAPVPAAGADTTTTIAGTAAAKPGASKHSSSKRHCGSRSVPPRSSA